MTALCLRCLWLLSHVGSVAESLLWRQYGRLGLNYLPPPLFGQNLPIPGLREGTAPFATSGPAGHGAGVTGRAGSCSVRERHVSSHVLTLLRSRRTPLRKGCLSAGGAGSWLSDHREAQEEGDTANPQGCPGHHVKTDEELKGVLWGHWGWDVGLGLGIQRPPWGKLVFIMQLSFQVLKSRGVYAAEHQRGEGLILSVVTENAYIHIHYAPANRAEKSFSWKQPDPLVAF